MPPTLVRPQTFTVLQQSDSASPAVRFVPEQNSYLICVFEGCATHCPFSLSQSANFSAPPPNMRTLMLGFLSPLSEWVNDQTYYTAFRGISI